MIKKETSLVVFVIFVVILLSSFVTSLDASIKVIHADYLHRAGITGNSNTICLITGGVDYTHLNLGGCTETSDINDGSCSKVIGGYDFADNDANPIGTGDHHGTLEAGIISSDHSKYKGVAPDSKLVVLKVFPDNGSIDEEVVKINIKSAMRWCIDNRTKYNISAISMSIGIINESQFSGYSDSDCPDYFNIEEDINDARSENILVVLAGGNDGFLSGLGDPSCISNATSVSATKDNDKVWFNSNVGTNLDLLAPGHRITSTIVGGGFKDTWNEVKCYLPFFVCYNSGTSFAAPHVAGALALLYEYDPALKSYEAEQMLKSESEKIDDFFSGLTLNRIDLAKALHIFDWPTENHDFRRTGFTLLKGDMDDESDVEKMSFVLDTSVTQGDQVMKPIVADIDGNGAMETVTLIHDTTYTDRTDIYAVEIEKKKKWIGKGYNYETTEKWDTTSIANTGDGAIYFPATLANIDSDSQKELITGVRNGTVYVYDISADGGTITERWRYHLSSRYSDYAGEDTVRFNGGTAVVDIDLDGNNEIIFADVAPSWDDPDWAGQVYVLGDSGGNPVLEANYTFYNGGAYATVSMANIDADDNPEIIVPSQYGIYVFDYDTGEPDNLALKWSNTDGLIWSSAVIADVDHDNEIRGEVL